MNPLLPRLGTTTSNSTPMPNPAPMLNPASSLQLQMLLLQLHLVQLLLSRAAESRFWFAELA